MNTFEFTCQIRKTIIVQSFSLNRKFALERRVDILRRPVLDRIFQLTLSFQLAECLRVGTEIVGRD